MMARRKKGKRRKNQAHSRPSAQGSRNRQISQPSDTAPTQSAAAPREENQPRRSQAQKRAADALEKIRALADGDDYGNYRPYVKALPARIIMNGLGQALAMEKAGAQAKKPDIRKGHEKLFGHVQGWLLNGWEHSPYGGQQDLIAAITTGSEADYIRAQGEAMAYVEWLKKFAVAYLKGEDDQLKDDQAQGGDDAAASQ